MSKKDQKNKVAVIGFGVTGQAVARFLSKKGVDIHVYDNREISDFDENVLVDYDNVEFHFETNDFDPTDFDYLVVSPGAPIKEIGAVGIAMEKGIPVHNDVTLFIEHWREINNGPIIGITGSNGKTTAVTLLHDSLEGSAPSVLGGNVGNSLLDILEDDFEENTVVILELSSFQLELFKQEHYLDVCLILNISSNHLDRYDGKVALYAETKTNGISSMKTKVIISSDDEWTGKYILPVLVKNKVKDVRTVSFETPLDQVVNSGMYMDANTDLVSVEVVPNKQSQMVVMEDTNERQLIGMHNLYNIAFVLASIEAADIEISDLVINKIRNFVGLSHRVEKVAQNEGVLYINDSKSTSPDAIRVALEAVGRDQNVVLIAGGDDKDMSFKELETILDEKVKHMIILPGNISKKLIDVAKLSDVSYEEVADMDESVKLAHENAVTGEVVLLSPGSYSKNYYKSYEERGEHFKELVSVLI